MSRSSSPYRSVALDVVIALTDAAHVIERLASLGYLDVKQRGLVESLIFTPTGANATHIADSVDIAFTPEGRAVITPSTSTTPQRRFSPSTRVFNTRRSSSPIIPTSPVVKSAESSTATSIVASGRSSPVVVSPLTPERSLSPVATAFEPSRSSSPVLRISIETEHVATPKRSLSPFAASFLPSRSSSPVYPVTVETDRETSPKRSLSPVATSFVPSRSSSPIHPTFVEAEPEVTSTVMSVNMSARINKSAEAVVDYSNQINKSAEADTDFPTQTNKSAEAVTDFSTQTNKSAEAVIDTSAQVNKSAEAVVGTSAQTGPQKWQNWDAKASDKAMADQRDRDYADQPVRDPNDVVYRDTFIRHIVRNGVRVVDESSYPETLELTEKSIDANTENASVSSGEVEEHRELSYTTTPYIGVKSTQSSCGKQPLYKSAPTSWVFGGIVTTSQPVADKKEKLVYPVVSEGEEFRIGHPLATTNRGRVMLTEMGHEEGSGLGPVGEGMLIPLPVSVPPAGKPGIGMMTVIAEKREAAKELARAKVIKVPGDAGNGIYAILRQTGDKSQKAFEFKSSRHGFNPVNGITQQHVGAIIETRDARTAATAHDSKNWLILEPGEKLEILSKKNGNGIFGVKKVIGGQEGCVKIRSLGMNKDFFQGTSIA